MDQLEVLRRRIAREKRARECAEQLLELKSQELYRANQVLLTAKIEAEQASIAKNQFIANMSHEIRTPLNAILGMVELLDDDNLTLIQKKRAMVIREAGVLLASTIDNILDIGRIESGAMSVEETRTDVRKLFEGIVSVFRSSAEQKGLSFHQSVDPALPTFILLDVTKFKQIATNLLGNAVKFTNSGHINCSLKYSVAASRKEIVFLVEDTGIGVAEDKVVEIFEPFKQSDNSITRRFGGTGLGLSIANSLAMLLGGTITLSSRPGVGSTFALCIPVTDLVDNLSPSSPNQMKGSSPFIRPPKILAIEDNPHNQEVLCGVLERLHAHAVIAENGQAGLDLIRTNPNRFDIILTDLHMPQLGGVELAKQIRRMGLTIPIIALTGDARTSTRDECLEYGMTDFLAKPFQINTLRNLLLHHLHSLVATPDCMDANKLPY